MTTKPPTKCLAYLGPDGQHRFDSESGWCLNGCGLRKDGRLHTTAGSVIDPGPTYYPEDLARISAQTTKETHHAQPLF